MAVLSASPNLAASVDLDDASATILDMSPGSETVPVVGPDEESRAWLSGLRAEGASGDGTRRRLHELLLRASRFEVNRRRATLAHLRGDDFDDLANQAADDALLAVLRKLDQYRGESRFTTWAYKFALLEASVKIRRRAWQGREVPVEPEHWSLIAAGDASPQGDAETGEVLASIKEAIESELSAHQREVLVAVALNDVPIDVLAQRLNTSRGALYKTIHDARKKLRAHLAEAQLGFADEPEAGEKR